MSRVSHEDQKLWPEKKANTKREENTMESRMSWKLSCPVWGEGWENMLIERSEMRLVPTPHTNSEGETVKVTTWFRCEAWGRQAEICNQYLHKGSKVLVEGRLKPDPKTGRPEIWTRQDGSSAADYNITVKEIYFLDSKNGDQIEPPAPPEDDIPF